MTATADAQQRHSNHARQRAADATPVVDAHGNEAGAVILGGRPAGCPRRYCGCETSRYVFGKIRPELNLASNWIKYFPRVAPAPGMVAARAGHVMVLMRHVDGNNWLVHDGNSGGGLTRQHVRSIAGHVVVNPHASRSAGRPPQRKRAPADGLAKASAVPAAPPSIAAAY